MDGQSRQREGMAEEAASRFGIQYDGWQKPAEANGLYMREESTQLLESV